MGHLITASILGAFDWMQHAPASWHESATLDFLAKVKREDKFEPTPEIKRGMQFEQMICDRVNVMNKEDFMKSALKDSFELCGTHIINVSDEEQNTIKAILDKFYDYCHGGNQQVKLCKDIEVDGEVYTLFGFADIVFPDKILDIKTCTKYKENKYTGSIQHSIYQYCSGIKDFKYIVCCFDGTLLPQQFYCIDATCGDLELVEASIKGRIRNMVTWLKQNNLYDEYLQNFCRGK